MLLKILIVILVLVAGLLLFAASKPDSFSVVRSINIHASEEQIFTKINNFSNWKSWSPWEKMDLDMQRTLSGPAEGLGAKYAWVGNDNVGQGSMEITESVPAKKVLIKLDFVKPFECHNIAEFNLAREGDSVKVTWEMRGPNLFIGKLMSIFTDMDKMVGKDFEAGLVNLKQIAETEANP